LEQIMPKRQPTPARKARRAVRQDEEAKFTFERRRELEEQERRSEGGGMDGPGGGARMEDGYRLTPVPQVILEAVGKLEHGTEGMIADEVWKTAPRVKDSTIVRTLKLFERLGIVDYFMPGWGAHLQYYLTRYAGHLHLKCEQCDLETEIGPASIRDPATARAEGYSFDPCTGHLTVYGRCDIHRKRLIQHAEARAAARSWRHLEEGATAAADLARAVVASAAGTDRHDLTVKLAKFSKTARRVEADAMEYFDVTAHAARLGGPTRERRTRK
jgi:Fur family transcriptional regulator, ferric uptake regulator